MRKIGAKNQQHMTKQSIAGLTVDQIRARYGLSRTQAYEARRRGYVLIREYPSDMPAGIDYREVARRSARYVAARQGYHVLAECEQAALIALWRDGARIGTDLARAYQAGRAAALVALRQWRHHQQTDLGLMAYQCVDWLPVEGEDSWDDWADDDGTHTGLAEDDMT